MHASPRAAAMAICPLIMAGGAGAVLSFKSISTTYRTILLGSARKPASLTGYCRRPSGNMRPAQALRHHLVSGKQSAPSLRIMTGGPAITVVPPANSASKPCLLAVSNQTLSGFTICTVMLGSGSKIVGMISTPRPCQPMALRGWVEIARAA